MSDTLRPQNCGCGAGSSQRTTPTRSMASPAQRQRTPPPSEAPGVQNTGDLLIRVKFNSGTPPSIVGRVYRRMVFGEQWYVAPQDVAYHPDWFEVVS